MAEDIFAGGITFIDDDVFLYVEADDFFAPDVVVKFEGTHQGSSPTSSTVAFTEKLTAQPSTLRDPKHAKGKKATRIPWKVNINKNVNFKDTTVILKFTVTGKSVAGANMVAPTQDKIVVGAITVTKDPKLTRIMVHEFARPSGNTFEFNPAPLQTHLASLTTQQKQTLFKHAIAKPQGRLVVFITIYPKKDLRMNADYCESTGPRHCVRPNATFSVFHCFEPLKGGVTLVCHTEHFLLNLRNSLGLTKEVKDPKSGEVTTVPRADPRDTWIWIHSIQDKKPANEWLKKSNPRPIQLKIASDFPQARNDGVLWSRIFTPKGHDIMLGNTMHGIINTVGCWMLFRNYNWPRAISDKLDPIFRGKIRGITAATRDRALAEAANDIARLGYDVIVAPAPNVATSLVKMLSADVNFAYLWFFHEVVGVSYFSDALSFGKREAGRRNVNAKTCVDTHKNPFEKTFAKSDIDMAPAFNLPSEKTFAYFDLGQRHFVEPSFQPSDALWRQNAMGFQASQGFIPKGKEFTDLTTAEIDRVSWADLYLYKEDAVDVNKLSTKNYSEDDPNV